MNMIDKLRELSKEVEGRYEARSDDRQASQEKIADAKSEATGLDVQDERVRGRLERLNFDPDTQEPLLEIAADGEKGFVEAPVDPNVLERIMGLNDLISVRFLEQGWRAAKAVGRINIANGLGFGTGFMISPRLMLTNNHVLPDSNTAALSFVEFDYQLGADGRRLPTQDFDFAPEEFFLTDEALDFTLVAVKAVNDREQDVTGYGWLPLIADENKVIVGEKLNIIQHPGGERKQLALRENHLEDILDNFLHYQTDTAPGSSGAPVFNDQWEVVALHHAGVPKTNEDGDFVTLNGSVWDDSMPFSQLAWKANEGIRISRIIKFIDDQELPEVAAPLWTNAQDDEQSPIDEVPLPAIAHIRTVGPQAARTAVTAADGEELPEELAAPLEELSQFDDRIYYDQEQDESDREAYYGSLAPQPALSPLLT